MSKFCVFCGKPPVDKNREHIIPQWLIEYTERGKAPVVKVLKNGKLEPKISYQNFTLPACEACNEKFSALEATTKTILLNVLADKPVTAREINTLMDWFDKVRLGLRLAGVYLEKDPGLERPHTFINDRTGVADRMLIVQKIDPQPNVRLAFPDTNTQYFKTAAQSFQFIIDNYAFISASSHLMVSSKLGFPYANEIRTVDAPSVSVANWQYGRGRARGPVFGDLYPSKDKIIIYQPIFKLFTDIPAYNTDYVKSHCIDFDNGIGGIFCQRGQTNEIKYLAPDEQTILRPMEISHDFKHVLGTAYSIQAQMLARAPRYNTSDARFNEYNNRLLEKYATELQHAIAAHR